jgi:NADPH:quinone reductase-like Zn-dependent oxidoreductase
MMVRLCAKDGIDLINIVRREEQAEMLRGMGARYILASEAPGFDLELRELAHRLGATLFLEAVGGDFTQRLIHASPDGSLILLYANLTRQPAQIIPNSLWHHDRRLEGFYLPVWTHKQGVLKVLLAARQAQLLAASDLGTTFQKRLHFTRAQEALELYRSNMTAGKVLLLME